MKTISVSEFAEKIGKTTRYVRELCKEGKLPSKIIEIPTGKKYLIYVGTSEYYKYLGEGSGERFSTNEEIEEGIFEKIEEGTQEGTREYPTPMQISALENTLEIIKEISKIKDNHKDEVVGLHKELLQVQQQTKLLEDFDRKKDEEINELRAKVKELEEKNKLLESKLNYYESKWWNKPILNKK